jgi:DNA polymerase-1
MAGSEFVSVKGEDPGWPFNRVVQLLVDRGEEIDAHRTPNGDAQAVKTWCPGPAHKPRSEGGGTRELVWAERPDGSVHVWCFKKDDTRPVLEHFGLTREDLHRGPDGQLLDGAVPLNPFRGTEGGTADLLVEWHGADLRYAEGIGWLGWDGRRWRPDEAAAVNAVRAVAARLYRMAAATSDPGRVKMLLDAARAADGDSHARGALWLARAHPRIRVQPGDLDANPWILTVENGTIDLTTGRLREHRRDDLATRLAPTPYRPDATDERWDRFVAEATAGKDGLREFLARAAGYTLTGSNREEVLFIAHGPAARGKTTFLEALAGAMGEYAGSVPIEALMDSRRGSSGHNEDIVRLVGRRLVTAVEASEHERLREGLVKSVTGGDTMSGSLKFKPSFEFVLTFKLWMATNDVPHMRADDTGLRRRIHKAPFDNAPATLDKGLKDHFRHSPDARAAILAWAVRGCLDWQRRGLDPPACVVDATTAMWEDLDQLAQFFDDRLAFGPDFTIAAADLQATYDSWAEEQGVAKQYRTSSRRRAARLRIRGCTEDKDREGIRGRFWWGVKEQDTQDLSRTPDKDPIFGASDTSDTSDPNSQSPSHTRAHEDHWETASQTSHVSQPETPTEADDRDKSCVSQVREAPGTRPATVIRSAGELQPVLPWLLQAPAVGLDIETTGLNPHRSSVRLVQLATDDDTYVVDIATTPITALQPVLDQAQSLIIHNGKFDLRHLAHAGLSLPADLGTRVRDTMLAAQLLAAGDPASQHRANLADVAKRYLDVDLDKAEQASDWSGELTEAQLRYAARDAAILLPLRAAISAALDEADLRHVAGLENRTLPAMVWLEDCGVHFDLDRLGALTRKAQADLLAAEQELRQLVGHPANWSSPKQVLAVLANLGIQVGDTAEDTIKRIDHPVGTLLLAYRKARKLAGMYGAEFAKFVEESTGRIHADFRQLGSVAGRMSCSGPNLQQVPSAREYRECFRAPTGRKLVKVDYSQIELRIAAEISQDPRLLAAYAAGEDLHSQTARLVLGRTNVTKADRQAAKAVNFGLLYGMGATRLRQYAGSSYGVAMTDDEAVAYRQAFFDAYTGLRAWHRRQPEQPVTTRTLAGRRRLEVLRHTEKLNTPVQGTGADGLKEALALLFERRDQCPGAFPVLVVHDEIVIECAAVDAEKATKWVTDAMVDGMNTYLKEVPVVVEATVADSWAGTP